MYRIAYHHYIKFDENTQITEISLDLGLVNINKDDICVHFAHKSGPVWNQLDDVHLNLLDHESWSLDLDPEYGSNILTIHVPKASQKCWDFFVGPWLLYAF